MIKLFTRYLYVGLLNTAIHWMIFSVLFYLTEARQAIDNLCAFLVAVTFSFYANAKWTFSSRASCVRYIAFVFFMGCLAELTGYIADKIMLPGIITTLVAFSSISLFVGFIYSKHIVSRDSK